LSALVSIILNGWGVRRAAKARSCASTGLAPAAKAAPFAAAGAGAALSLVFASSRRAVSARDLAADRLIESPIRESTTTSRMRIAVSLATGNLGDSAAFGVADPIAGAAGGGAGAAAAGAGLGVSRAFPVFCGAATDDVLRSIAGWTDAAVP
jgi:hypothetical protein